MFSGKEFAFLPGVWYNQCKYRRCGRGNEGMMRKNHRLLTGLALLLVLLLLAPAALAKTIKVDAAQTCL